MAMDTQVAVTTGDINIATGNGNGSVQAPAMTMGLRLINIYLHGKQSVLLYLFFLSELTSYATLNL